MKFLYIIILIQFVVIQASAILGGHIVKNESLKKSIIIFDARLKLTSIVCSGSVISKNKILTAAHCFDHLNEANCLSSNECQSKILIKNKAYEFEINIHPKYKTKNKSRNYLSKSNYDLAIISFKDKIFNNSLQINLTHTPVNQLKFYGYGMSHLEQKFSNGTPYYHETVRGKLKTGDLKSLFLKDGLIVSKQNTLNLDNINNSITQVLRSDSGGPLISGNKIVGIVRNYEIQDTIWNDGTEVSKKLPVKYETKELKISSTFTLLNDPDIKDFINKHK